MRFILQLVSDEPRRYTWLCKKFVRASGSPASFESIFRFLKINGYVEKVSAGHCAPYRLTARGRRFLEGLL